MTTIIKMIVSIMSMVLKIIWRIIKFICGPMWESIKDLCKTSWKLYKERKAQKAASVGAVSESASREDKVAGEPKESQGADDSKFPNNNA